MGANAVSIDEARRIAANIAKRPELSRAALAASLRILLDPFV
jgi:hypothetical protein